MPRTTSMRIQSLRQAEWIKIQTNVLEDQVRQVVYLAMANKQSYEMLRDTVCRIKKQDKIDRRWLLTDLYTVLATMHREESTTEDCILLADKARCWPVRRGKQSLTLTTVLDPRMRDFDKIRAFQEQHITDAVDQAQEYYSGITKVGAILCWLLHYQSRVERTIHWSAESRIPSRSRREEAFPPLEGTLGTLINSPLSPRISAALTALEYGWTDFGTHDSVYAFMTVVRTHTLSDMDWAPFWPRLSSRAGRITEIPPVWGQIRTPDHRYQCRHCRWPRTPGIHEEKADLQEGNRLEMNCRCRRNGMAPPEWAKYGRHATHRLLLQTSRREESGEQHGG